MYNLNKDDSKRFSKQGMFLGPECLYSRIQHNSTIYYYVCYAQYEDREFKNKAVKQVNHFSFKHLKIIFDEYDNTLPETVLEMMVKRDIIQARIIIRMYVRKELWFGK